MNTLICDSLLRKVTYIKNIGCIGNIGLVFQYSDINFEIYVFPEEKSKQTKHTYFKNKSTAKQTDHVF